MVAIAWRCDKADIRQIAGRDWPSRRKSAILYRVGKSVCKPRPLMSKGLQGF